MKTKEPNRTIFSADESPVPLPSVEEAWSDMRKRLDEEMPERALFFWLKRGILLVLLVLLSLGAFWLMRRTGETVRPGGGGTIVRAKDSGQGVGGQREGDRHGAKEGDSLNRAPNRGKEEVTDKEKEGAADRGEGTADQRKEGDRSGEMPGVEEPGKLRDAAQKKDMSNAGTKNERTGMDPQRAVIDSRLAQTGAQDAIRVKADMPRGTARTGKRNAPKPEQPQKSATEDSTRILWAAGLQDSKSFPVGAQKMYNYDANLKKDIWADYIPSPYFQYHPGRKIMLQTAIQLNNPQYTESVTIFREQGDTSSGATFVNDTTVTVKKLYYFNIPLTVYYSPFRNLYIGAGLQFSNLRNGVAFQNNVIHHVSASSLTDTVTTSTVISLKENRPAYNNLRKTDWRALFEINYYWRRLTVAFQYQQGLGDYLYTPVEGSSGRDRNSSFNIYLRYNLWERRIRITPKN